MDSRKASWMEVTHESSRHDLEARTYSDKGTGRGPYPKIQGWWMVLREREGCHGKRKAEARSRRALSARTEAEPFLL